MKIKTNIPDSLPLKKLPWDAWVTLLGQAHRTIAKFDEIIKAVPKPSVLYLLKIDEALASVHTVKGSLKKVLCPQVFAKDPKEMAPILNYAKALDYACRQKRLTNHVLCTIHSVCKKDSTHNKKELGRFRDRQNWIGPEGCPIEKGLFFPPEPSRIAKCMKNLQAYLSYREKDPLVQIAIYFAQFLCIHPFMDGNGRVGRSFLAALLWQKKLTSYPLFFFSGYFSRHYDAYFDRLFYIFEEDGWEKWIIFFLKGVVEEGERNCKKANKLTALYNKWARELSNSFPPEITEKSLDFLFKNPIFSRQKFIAHTKIPLATQEKIIRSLKISKSHGIFVCKPILSAI